MLLNKKLILICAVLFFVNGLQAMHRQEDLQNLFKQFLEKNPKLNNNFSSNTKLEKPINVLLTVTESIDKNPFKLTTRLNRARLVLALMPLVEDGIDFIVNTQLEEHMLTLLQSDMQFLKENGQDQFARTIAHELAARKAVIGKRGIMNLWLADFDSRKFDQCYFKPEYLAQHPGSEQPAQEVRTLAKFFGAVE